MLSFKKYLVENTKGRARTSDSIHNFMTHLMSGIVGPGISDSEKSSISEATLIDTLNKDTRKQSGKQVEVPNVLAHPAVAEKDNPEHAGRYESLMANGRKIAAAAGGGGKVYTQARRGFQAYTQAVEAGGEKERKSRVRAANAAHREWRQSVAGYGGGADYFGSNTKIAKNTGNSEHSTGLSLSPYTMHGVPEHNGCVKATTECRNSCLAFTTGKNAMLSNINSKIAKHQFLLQHPEHAAAIIEHEMRKHVDETARYNTPEYHANEVSKHSAAVQTLEPGSRAHTLAQKRLSDAQQAQQDHANGRRYQAGFRLNVLQDYDMQHLMGGIINRVNEHAKKSGVTTVFRDYTKHPERMEKPRPENMHLAFSATGANHDESNEHHVGHILNNGHTVAAVVANSPEHGKITHFYDHMHDRYHPVVDGDEDDMIERRHEEAGFTKGPDQRGYDAKGRRAGVVSGLEIKGASGEIKKMAGKFVHVANPNFDVSHVDSHGRSLPAGAVVSEINTRTHRFGKPNNE